MVSIFLGHPVHMLIIVIEEVQYMLLVITRELVPV